MCYVGTKYDGFEQVHIFFQTLKWILFLTQQRCFLKCYVYGHNFLSIRNKVTETNVNEEKNSLALLFWFPKSLSRYQPKIGI